MLLIKIFYFHLVSLSMCTESIEQIDTLFQLMDNSSSIDNPLDWNITFNMFTPKDPNKQIVFNLSANESTINDSEFDPKLKTKFIVHGWTSGLYVQDMFKRQWMKDMKDFILEQIDCNVICVDWSKEAADDDYLKVLPRTPTVGQIIANFIQQLINAKNVSLNDIHCIGHSLGAHICGYTAINLGPNKLAQITGLDPARPGFISVFSRSMRSLKSSDANLVVVMHTSDRFKSSAGYNLGGFMAISASLGHCDFRVNGGNFQPLCKQSGTLISSLWKALKMDWTGFSSELRNALFCAHDTAYKYPIAKPGNGCQFIAYVCANKSQFDGGLCAQQGMPLELNFDFYDNLNNKLNETKPPNNLYINLGDTYPYCLFHYQIVFEIEDHFSTETKVTLFGQKRVDIQMKFSPKNKENIYYYLYTDVEELGTVYGVSYDSSGVKIKAIFVNYLSHINKKTQKSSKPRLNQMRTNDTWSHWMANHF